MLLRTWRAISGAAQPKKPARCAGRVDGHQRAVRSVLELVADEHREGPVDLQLDQPVGFVLRDDVPVVEGAAEERRGAFDGRAVCESARAGPAGWR